MEDLYKDVDELNRSIEYVQQIFGGEKVRKTIVVIGNKRKISHYGEEKSERIKSRCVEINVKYLEFETTYDQDPLSSEQRFS